MVKFTDVERVVVCEQNPLLLTPPFPTPLTAGATVDLCSVTLNLGRDRDAVLLQAVVNWEAIFTPLAIPVVITVPGFAQVTFQILLNGATIYQVIQTAVQPAVPIGIPFATATAAFEIASLLHFDLSAITGIGSGGTYTLRATNIILTPPTNVAGTVIIPAGTTTAAVGAVTLIAAEIEACRALSV